MAQCLALLDAAVIAMAVGIFETQAHLWTIFLQVDQLLAVERSSALPESKSRNELAQDCRSAKWTDTPPSQKKKKYTLLSWLL